MKQFLLTLACTCCMIVLFAQNDFPALMVGNWKGTMQWSQPGKGQPQQVPMELRIQPQKDSIGQYSWHLIYGKGQEDSRPYVLKPVDAAKGHWIVDEGNGILLDQFWLGGKLSGSFSVQKTTILNSYWIEKGQLHIEFFSLSTDAISTSGEGTEESPRVLSYGLRGYQKAILTKQ